MFDSTKRKLPRRRPTTRLILHRANAYNQNIQALAAKEGCGSLSRTFQMFQEGVAEFAVIPRTARAGRTQASTCLSIPTPLRSSRGSRTVALIQSEYVASYKNPPR